MKVAKVGINSTLRTLRKYSNMDVKLDEASNQLAEIGAKVLREAHAGVMGVDHSVRDGRSVPVYSDIEVEVENFAGETSIVARGRNFTFFEFGAGVKKNSPRSYENVLNVPVPSAIAGIGEYGYGQGKNQSWLYQQDKKPIITGGYAARHGFANAINRIVARSPRVVKGVLK